MPFSPLDSSEDFMVRGGFRFSLSLIVAELWHHRWRNFHVCKSWRRAMRIAPPAVNHTRPVDNDRTNRHLIHTSSLFSVYNLQTSGLLVTYRNYYQTIVSPSKSALRHKQQLVCLIDVNHRSVAASSFLSLANTLECVFIPVIS